MDENSHPFVSVIIPIYKDWKRLRLCVDALMSQSYPKDYFEVIIVNNDPMDPFPDDLKKLGIVLLEESKPGSYAARNRGIKAAKGEILAFTDSDCVPHEDWILNAVAQLLREPEVQRLAGRIIVRVRESKPSWTEEYDRIFAFRQEELVKRRKAAVTANLITRTSAFEKVGLFDERLFSGGDMQWSDQCNRLHQTISYCSDAIVYHPARQKLSSLLKKNKRVMGGALDEAASFNTKGNRSVFRKSVTTIRRIRKVLMSRDISCNRKASVCSICLVVWICEIYYMVGYRVGIIKPSRS